MTTRKYVMPSEQAIESYWHDPGRFIWPGEVVHELERSNGSKIIQFLLFNKQDSLFVLKTWNQVNLVPHDESARVAGALDTIIQASENTQGASQ